MTSMKWIKPKEWKVVQSRDYYGGMGRVWLVPSYCPKPPKINRHAIAAKSGGAKP